jgi:hypothetical protein
LRRAGFDSVTKPAEFSDHFSGALLLGRFPDLWASFLVVDSPVQYLPDQATKFVSNYSDGLIVSHTRNVAAIENFEDASFVFDRRIGSLIQNPPHVTVALWRPAAVAAAKPGPFQEFYDALVAKGIRPEMARLTLARKIAAITLTVWKKGVSFDAKCRPRFSKNWGCSSNVSGRPRHATWFTTRQFGCAGHNRLCLVC